MLESMNGEPKEVCGEANLVAQIEDEEAVSGHVIV